MVRPRLFLGSIPRTAFSTANAGLVARRREYVVSVRPPGYPEWRRASFFSSLPPVSRTPEAFTTTT